MSQWPKWSKKLRKDEENKGQRREKEPCEAETLAAMGRKRRRRRQKNEEN